MNKKQDSEKKVWKLDVNATDEQIEKVAKEIQETHEKNKEKSQDIVEEVIAEISETPIKELRKLKKMSPRTYSHLYQTMEEYIRIAIKKKEEKYKEEIEDLKQSNKEMLEVIHKDKTLALEQKDKDFLEKIDNFEKKKTILKDVPDNWFAWRKSDWEELKEKLV